MRTDGGGGQATSRRRRRRVEAETSIPSAGASRSLTSALVAKPSATSASRRRLVLRAYDCTRSEIRSVKVYQRIKSLSKQANSLNLRMSPLTNTQINNDSPTTCNEV